MATGRVPFEGDNPAEVARKHVSDPPAPPSALNPATPSYLEQAILWALAKDPAQRPPTAGELGQRLLQFEQMQHEETRVMPITRGDVSHTARMPLSPAAYEPSSNGWPLFALFLLAVGLILGLIPLWTAVIERWRG